MGVLSALPLISAGNICCCMWVLGGGAVAAYLYQQSLPGPITPGDGALVGLLAGLIGAVVQFAISIPIGLLVAPMERAFLQGALEIAGTMPPEMRDMIERYGNPDAQFGAGFMIMRRIAALVGWVFVGGIFSTLGGLIGAMIFQKKTPPGVIDVPPSA